MLIPERTQLGGFGGGQMCPTTDQTDGIVPYDFSQGARGLATARYLRPARVTKATFTSHGLRGRVRACVSAACARARVKCQTDRRTDRGTDEQTDRERPLGAPYKPTKDKTLIQLETEGSNYETASLYATLRKLTANVPAGSSTKLNVSFLELEHNPTSEGRDGLCVTVSKPHHFKVKHHDFDKQEVTAKTVFAFGLKADTFPTDFAAACFRFRRQKVGGNLKPMKPYMVLKKAISLAKGCPTRI